MKESFMVGISFGLTSGTITTLGLMIGLNSGTNSKIAVIAGVLTIAIADAMSDAIGIHFSRESNGVVERDIWESTIATFLSKFLFAITFIVPILTLDLNTAIIINIIYGLSMLTFLSYYIARTQGTNPREVIIEHLLISIAVIIIAYLVGLWIHFTFGS